MLFDEKLNLLMNITRTSNSLLARNIALDASFISRLRRGVRTPVENAEYIPAMARYFSRICNSDYQKAALFEAIKNSSSIKPHQSENMETLLLNWLLEKTPDHQGSIDDFLKEVAGFHFKKPAPAAKEAAALNVPELLKDVEIFYGVEGKRTAVLHFLSLVLQNKTPQTLLLYSNEDMRWMSEDPEYFARWTALMFQILKNGNRIKIIHTINRDFNEMLTGIKGWVPIYMTGAIEPYYCPRTRDNIFRRTLFIAPQTAAVTSSSVRDGIENTVNLLFTRQKALLALQSEFHDFLALCRPLMHIFNPLNQGDYLEILAEFEAEKSDTILKTNTLSHITMPTQLMLRRIASLPGKTAEPLLTYQQKKTDRLLALLENHSFTEMLILPKLETILQGQAIMEFSDMPGGTPSYYTPQEFKEHLEHVIKMLKTHKNYHIHLINDKQLAGSMVYVKEGVGVLVGKTTPPSVFFAINESNMTAAFLDYINIHFAVELENKSDRQETISRLETMAAHL
jgi:hypothetical protein